MDFGDIIWIAILLLGAFGGSAKKLVRGLKEAADTVEIPTPAYEPSATTPEDVPPAPEYWDPNYEIPETEPYFSYETATEEQIQKEAGLTPAVSTLQANVKPVAGESALGEPFDLRKAVIYQTIMQRVS